MENPSTDQIRAVLKYDPETGLCTWLPRKPHMFQPTGTRGAEGCCANWNSRYAGSPAMTYIGSHGYRAGNLFGKVRLLHRVAMALILDHWDFDHVDHINGDKLDNRAVNLRPCTNAENLRNGLSRGGSSRFKGVCFHKQNKNWISSITLNGKTTHLGSFESEVDAAIAYDKAAKEMHGKFARTNF